MRALWLPIVLLSTYVSTARAQASIGLAAGSTATVQVALGGKLAVPLLLDVSKAGGASVASLAAELEWNTAALTLDSLVAGTFGTLDRTNTASATGRITFGVFSASAATGTVTIATAYFTASSTLAGTRLHLDVSEAANLMGALLTTPTNARGLDVCVSPLGMWGDVNGDATVNILDAQQIARAAVGLSVANQEAYDAAGDLNADGAVNVIDAQQAARFSIGLSAPTRTGTATFVPPAVAGVSLSPGATLNVGVGSHNHVAADLRSASGAPLAGCVPVEWTSGDTTKAKVNNDGEITGVAPGVVVLTPKVRGRPLVGANGVVSVTATVGTGASNTGVTIDKVSGDQQYGYWSTTAALAPRVRVKDAYGVPVPDAHVSWRAVGGSLGTTGVTVLESVTDSTGTTVPPSPWVMPGAGTTATLVATINNGVSTTFTINLMENVNAQHACALVGGTAYCWGAGTRGELGTGVTNGSAVAVPVAGSVTFASLSSRMPGEHSCGVSTTGAAYCWGNNAMGQLGNGLRTDASSPQPVAGALTFSKISTGLAHTCGLTTAGLAYCWGVNLFGQVGDSTVGTSYPSPVAVKMPTGVTFTDISAGGNFTCAVANTGDGWCWGFGGQGNLGTGGLEDRRAPTKVVGVSGLAAISSGTSHSCGITAAGEGWCWGLAAAAGDGSASTAARMSPVRVSGGHVFTEISAGDGKTCAAKSDGSLWCWGTNTNGQIGNGSTVNAIAPSPIPGNGSKIVAIGFNTVGATCALNVGGLGVSCWGQNNLGQLGDGSSTLRTTPVSVLLPNAVAGAAASIRPSATSFSQTGTAAIPVTNAPSVTIRDGRGYPVSGVTVTFSVVTGGGTMTGATATSDANGVATIGSWTLGSTAVTQILQASATMSNGTVSRVQFYATATPATSAVSTMIKVSGDSVAHSGQGTTPLVTPTVRILNAGGQPVFGVTVTFTAGASTTTAVTDSTGTAAMLGSTVFAISSTTTVTASAPGIAVPATFTVFGVVNSSSLRNTHCAIAKSNGRAYCWGAGALGQLGDGTTVTQRNYALPVSGAQTFVRISEQQATHRCALTAAGAAWCWGSNSLGQLGDGTATNRSVPTLATVPNGVVFTQIVTQGVSTCALTAEGEVWCWGWMQPHGFGLPAYVERRSLLPVKVDIGTLRFAQIALGDNAMCGRTAAGAVYCAGDNAAGQVGDGSFVQRNALVAVAGGVSFKAIGGSTSNFCGVSQDGRAYCWGSSNGTGAVGDGASVSRNSPTLIASDESRFAEVSLANFSICARRVDGKLACWGSNTSGQLGSGTFNASLIPIDVDGVRFLDASINSFRGRCGIVTNGQMYCWGQNNNGQLGDSTSVAQRTTPVAVVGWPDGPAAGSPATLSLPSTWVGSVSGNTGATLTNPPQVIVRDRLNAPVANATVTFGITSGGGTLIGSIVKTDNSGTATATSLTLPSTAGVVELSASVDGLPPIKMFVNVVAATTVGSLTIVSGDQQRQSIGAVTLGSLGVIVRDLQGQPASGISVTFTTSGGGLLTTGTSGGAASASATSDANGLARMTYTVPSTVGSQTITATAGSASVTFTEFSVPQFVGDAECAIRSTGAVYCWGDNRRGQVGDGTTVDKNVPTAVVGAPTLTKLAVGAGDHMCGLTAAGAAWCWGANSFGQLGDSTTTDRTSATLVKGGLSFTQLAISRISTCGLTNAGTMYCWGSTDESLFGDAVVHGIVTGPKQVTLPSGLTFSSIGIGRNLACGLTSGGKIWCWGGGGFTGDGTSGGTTTTTPFTIRVAPAPINDGRSYKQIAVGEQYACAVTVGNQALCWGGNGSGQLGDGTTTSRTSPVPVSTTRSFSSIAVALAHSCALDTSGAMYCWGANSDGRAGDGTVAAKLVPSAVSGGITFSSMHLGATHSCAIGTASVPFCWGPNSRGFAGNGTFTSTVTQPVSVNWFDGTSGTPISIGVNNSPATSAAGGTVLSNVLSVKVRDFAGTLLNGATVTWAVTAGGGTISNTTVNTVSGIATLPSWTLGASPGVNTVTASIAGVGTVVFTVVVN